MSRRRRDHNFARKLARAAHYKQGGLCYWCNRPMKLMRNAGDGYAGEIDPLLMTAEHIIPVNDNGLTRAGNVVAACYECNNARGNGNNQMKRGFKFTVGDDTPSSPFARLRGNRRAE
jgi:hypothetical protein